MWIRIVIAAVVGAVAGALLGRLGKCATGACPMTGSPVGMALLGAVLGAVIAAAFSNPRPTKPTAVQDKENAMPERAGLVTMKGNPVVLVGNEVQSGHMAPDFVAIDNDLKEVRLSSFRGKVVVLSAVPSLDTSVCSLQTRRFNQEAAGLGNDVAILTISMDLPFAQKRWCGAEGVQAVKTLSDHRDAAFGKAYGVLIKDLRLLARAVFVVDRAGRVTYVQLVKEIASEPDYEAVLKAAREAVGK
jgi:thiol peroxidase